MSCWEPVGLPGISLRVVQCLQNGADILIEGRKSGEKEEWRKGRVEKKDERLEKMERDEIRRG